MRGLIAIGHEIVIAARDAEFLARNAGERLERRTRRATAVRAVADQGIGEFVRHRVAHRAAEAFSGQDATICFF